jgi:hypothetical protein
MIASSHHDERKKENVYEPDLLPWPRGKSPTEARNPYLQRDLEEEDNLTGGSNINHYEGDI